jgi:hypothetical protein
MFCNFRIQTKNVHYHLCNKCIAYGLAYSYAIYLSLLLQETIATPFSLLVVVYYISRLKLWLRRMNEICKYRGSRQREMYVLLISGSA